VGYAKYIDVDSFIDHNLLNMLALNVDALRLSTHLHKTRAGKLEMGPLWDFDRALDSTDGRDNNARSWHGTGDGTDYHKYVWWNRLFEDTNFWQKYIDRWYVLRAGPFNTVSLNATIDAMADEIREAQAAISRNGPVSGPDMAASRARSISAVARHPVPVGRWPIRRPTGDSPGGRPRQAGTQVTLVNPHTGGVLYYTLDGSDPRPPGVASTLLASTTLLRENAPKRVLVPTGSIGNAWWSSQSFDDTSWVSGAGGVGFERGSGYGQYFTINVGDAMYGRNSSCYIRVPFTISIDPARSTS
jgi:hypothetical protein